MTLPKPEAWSEGIYFGLDEDLYHALPWCGSTDIKQLAFFPQDYWAGSAMNPLRDPPKEETPAMRFGTAIHYGVLYGEEVFRKRYGYMAGDTGKDGVSAEGLKDWITQQGGKPAKLKADNERMVWKQFDTILLTEDQFNKVLMAHRTIKSNPYLVEAFTKGFPEVSIFWRQEGVPCKARIDYLKLKASVDLKSISSRGRLLTFDEMALADIFGRGYRYDAQAAHYQDGRLAAAELHKAGKVFMAYDEHTPEQLRVRPSDDWLAQALGNPEPWWAFVFFKTDGMTVANSYQSRFNGPMMASGGVVKRRALTNYQAMMERFGTEAWVVTDEPFNVDEEDVPKWL